MICTSTLAKDIGAVLSSSGSDEFSYEGLAFKGRFKSNAEVMYDDRSIGYCYTFLMSKKDFDNAKLTLKSPITNTKNQKTYKITQICNELDVLKRLILEEIPKEHQNPQDR